MQWKVLSYLIHLIWLPFCIRLFSSLGLMYFNERLELMHV